MKPAKKTACGGMWCREDGVDLACKWDGKVHTLRLRYSLGANREVRLVGTGVAYGRLVRVHVRRRRIVVTPRAHATFVRKCIANARPLLHRALHTYLHRFPTSVRGLLHLNDAMLVA
jgi:hypothetical protein